MSETIEFELLFKIPKNAPKDWRRQIHKIKGFSWDRNLDTTYQDKDGNKHACVCGEFIRSAGCDAEDYCKDLIVSVCDILGVPKEELEGRIMITYVEHCPTDEWSFVELFDDEEKEGGDAE